MGYIHSGAGRSSLQRLEQLDDLDVGVQEAVETVADALLLFRCQRARRDVLRDTLLETHVRELCHGRLDLRLGRFLLDEPEHLLPGALVEALQQCGVDVLAHSVTFGPALRLSLPANKPQTPEERGSPGRRK